MRIGGVDPTTLPVDEVLVLPRGDQQVVFVARGVAGWDDFFKMCPEPVMPVKLTAKGTVNDETDDYKAAHAEWARRQEAYMYVKSLEPSDIVWDTVKPDVPGTWVNWRDDLVNNKFTWREVQLIQNLVHQANALDEAKLEKARELFLRGPQPA